MIATFTRSNGAKVAISVLHVLTITPNAANTQCVIDMAFGASFTINASLETVRATLLDAIPANVNGFLMRMPP